MNRPFKQHHNDEINSILGAEDTSSSGLLPFEQQTGSEAAIASASSDTNWSASHPPERYIGVGVVNVHIGKMELEDRSEAIPMVARVSLIDYRGRTLLDTYVRPTHPVEDYNITQTGLSYHHLCNAPLFADVQRRIAAYIQDKILVGHRIWNFLSVLGLSHPALYMRDFALFRPMRKRVESRVLIELPALVKIFMGRDVGFQYEDSMELSRAAMDLFRSCQEIFEEIIAAGEWPCDLPPSRFAEHYS